MSQSLQSYLPQLQGLRAVAAIGVLITHVSFQTAVQHPILERFDYFVAVFFALSAFVLARNYTPSAVSFYRRRAWRLLPAYWVCVLLTFAVFPVAFGIPWPTLLATLSFTQIYLPGGLYGGFTHLWSLCIEVAFYLALPALMRFPRTWPWLIVLSLLWTLLPFPHTEGGINFQIFPCSYFLWFAVGLYAAKYEALGRHRLGKIAAWRPMWWVLALLVCWAAGQSWFGPQGLTHPTPVEFFRRILGGALFAALVLWPYVFSQKRSLLDSQVMQLIGRWSYSLFLWHIPVLSVVFPVLGVQPFQGELATFVLVLLVTLAASLTISWASYELVERSANSMRGRTST